jgi:hypothetical protein
MLVDEVQKSVTGDPRLPWRLDAFPNWPGIATGTRGTLNALSPKYCNWSDIVDVEPKAPVLWTHGSADIVVADGPRGRWGRSGNWDSSRAGREKKCFLPSPW